MQSWIYLECWKNQPLISYYATDFRKLKVLPLKLDWSFKDVNLHEEEEEEEMSKCRKKFLSQKNQTFKYFFLKKSERIFI